MEQFEIKLIIIIITSIIIISNIDIIKLWTTTSNHTNIQYDAYKSTKQALKEFHSVPESKLAGDFTSQGFFFANVMKFSFTKLNKFWLASQSKLPKFKL